MRAIQFFAGVTVLACAAALSATAGGSVVDAVKNGDREAVRLLIKQHANVNTPEVDGTTALHWAARQDDVETASLLIAAGANVNAANRYGVKPIALAATNGSAAMIELLLKAGADPNSVSSEGETAIMTAARSGNPQAVKLLAAKGANVNATEGWQGQTALMWAAAENHPDAIKMLVEFGADKNAKSKVLDGMPPLRAAAPDVGQQGIHSTFPKGGMTALLYAARQGNAEAVAALADSHVDLNQGDPDGFTAMIFAILNAHYDVAALLVEKGADINRADNSGRTPLYTAVDMHTFEYSFNRPTAKPDGKMDAVDLVKFLLAHGADPNRRLTDRVKAAKYDTAGNRNLIAGATPLLKAVSTSDITLVRILLDAGADPFIRNAQHTNALLVAAGLNWRHEGGIGPEPDAIEVLKILLDRGLDIHSYNDLGQTVLHAAAMRGRGGAEDGPDTVGTENVARFLIAHGADLNAKDKLGRTPLDVAIDNKSHKVAAIYQEMAGQQASVKGPSESLQK
jgi:ankyrin repeat protein